MWPPLTVVERRIQKRRVQPQQEGFSQLMLLLTDASLALAHLGHLGIRLPRAESDPEANRLVATRSLRRANQKKWQLQMSPSARLALHVCL